MQVMKVIFDNNAFAYLAQSPERQDTLMKLKRLAKQSKLQILGTCTLLRELSGLALSNVEMYLTTLSHYEELINQKILIPAIEALVIEAHELRPLHYEQSLLDKERVDNFLFNLRDPSLARELFGETASLKTKYGESLEGAVRELLDLPELQNATASDVRIGYREWFQQFPSNLQDWFVHHFNVTAKCSAADLPHVSAYLGYALTRIHERFTFGKKNRPNDLLDREHFTDAAVVDTLVTNDAPFTRTALLVPNRTFEVMNIEEFAEFVNRLAAA